MNRKKGLLTKYHLQATYLFPYLNIDEAVLLVFHCPAPATHRRQDTVEGRAVDPGRRYSLIYVVGSIQSWIMSISLELGAGPSFRCTRGNSYLTLSPLFFLFRAR